MGSEGLNKSLQFLHLDIVNTGDDDHTMSMCQNNAITNVQVKPNSEHDPKVLRGIFTGFLHSTLTNCKPTQREEEITFLIFSASLRMGTTHANSGRSLRIPKQK